MNPSPNAEVSSLLTRYQVAFAFLSQVFYQSPLPEFVSRLAKEDYLAAWPLTSDEEDTSSGLMLMRRYCAAWDERRLSDLEADFSRLFVGPGTPLAPPWESYYLSPDRLLFQERTLAVRETYRQFGLDSPNLRREPDDSLGLELGFLAELCIAGQDALRNRTEDQLDIIRRGQQTFLRDHLLQWAPECLTLVITHAREDYYRGAASLARGCLSMAAEDF